MTDKRREEGRLTLFLPPELKRKAKAQAALEGVSLTDLVTRLLEKYLVTHLSKK